MSIYKNNPNYQVPYTSINSLFSGWKCQNQGSITKQKITFLEFIRNQHQTRIKPVYDRVYRGNSHYFQCHTM